MVISISRLPGGGKHNDTSISIIGQRLGEVGDTWLIEGTLKIWLWNYFSDTLMR